MKQIPNRSEQIPTIRLTPLEKEQLMEEYNKTYHSSIAAFVREKIFAKEITAYHKKKIDLLLQLTTFRKELNQLGNNVNQIAKVVNTYKNGKLQTDETILLEELLRELVAVNAFLDDITL